MQPEIILSAYYTVETTDGTCILPVDAVGYPPAGGINDTVPAMLADYLPTGTPSVDAIEFVEEAYPLMRFTMPGYLDATDWRAYNSLEELVAEIAEFVDEGEGLTRDGTPVEEYASACIAGA